MFELISGWFEDPINFGKFGLKKGTGVDPPPPRVDNVPFFLPFFLFEGFPNHHYQHQQRHQHQHHNQHHHQHHNQHQHHNLISTLANVIFVIVIFDEMKGGANIVTFQVVLIKNGWKSENCIVLGKTKQIVQTWAYYVCTIKWSNAALFECFVLSDIRVFAAI